MAEAAPSAAGATARPGVLTPSWLAAQGRLPLAFMGLGLAWLLAAVALLAVWPEVLALPHVHPRVVALTHAWVLGFFVTVACGAIYQLAPVALGTTLRSERQGWWHLGLHAVGVPGMVHAFWIWDLGLVGHFGALVGMGVVLFAVNTWRTVGQAVRRGTVALSLRLAAGWLLVTVLLGLVLSANRHWAFIPMDPLALLRAHAHLGLVGFFVTLLQGVGFQLIPMFTLGEVKDWRLANRGLALSQAGLVALAPGLAWGWGWVAWLAAVALAGGLVCSAVALREVLGTRKKRVLDAGTSTFLRGGVGLLVAAAAGVELVAPTTPWGSAPGGFGGMAYAIMLFAGGLLPCFTGMLCKIVPFLTWMRAYGPRVGREPTPAASALSLPRMEQWSLALQHAAALPLVVGAWILEVAWLRAGAWLLAAATVLYVVNHAAVLRHLRRGAVARPRPVVPADPAAAFSR